MRIIQVWHFLNDIKVQAVKILPEEKWLDVKLACDDLFRQVGGGNICPAWWIGGWGGE